MTLNDLHGIIGVADASWLPDLIGPPADPPDEDLRGYAAGWLATGRVLLWGTAVGGGQWDVEVSRSRPAEDAIRYATGALRTDGKLVVVSLAGLLRAARDRRPAGEEGLLVDVPAGGLRVVVAQHAADWSGDGPQYVASVAGVSGDRHAIWAEPAWIDEGTGQVEEAADPE